MELKQFDHIVLTTQDLERCLHFYRDVLGMRVREQDGRYALLFGSQKINIHRRKAEFLPAAAHPVCGSLDLCILADGDIGTIRAEVEAKGWPVEEGPVERHGACGVMDSIYLRDPDGNLVEIGVPGKAAGPSSR